MTPKKKKCSACHVELKSTESRATVLARLGLAEFAGCVAAPATADDGNVLRLRVPWEDPSSVPWLWLHCGAAEEPCPPCRGHAGGAGPLSSIVRATHLVQRGTAARVGAFYRAVLGCAAETIDGGSAVRYMIPFGACLHTYLHACQRACP